MSVNILNLLKDQIGGQLAGSASKYLGESESSVSKALDGIFPSLLGSMVNNTSDEGMMGKLFDMAKGSNFDDISDVSSMFGGGGSKALGAMNMGGTLLNLLMGNKTGAIIDLIAKFAGIKGSTTSSLLKLAAPFLLRTLSKQITGGGLNLGGFMDLLKGQKSHVASALPSGLGSLGFADGIKDVAGDAMDAGKKVVGGAVNVAGDAVDAGKKVVGGAADLAGDVGGAAVKTGGSLLKYIIPAILALLVLGFFGRKGCNTGIDAVDKMAEKTMDVTEGATKGAVGVAGDAVKGAADLAKDGAAIVTDAAGDAVDAAGNVVDAAADIAKGAFSNVNEAGKKALDAVKFTAGSAGDQMTNFISNGFKGDNKFIFKNLNFDTGSAKISGQTGTEVDNLAAIMNAYPDMKISVAGFTDNTGDEKKNQQLSLARADAVKARLMARKIAGQRVATAGAGSLHPVADNGTAEGRAQNRRIEVSIVY